MAEFNHMETPRYGACISCGSAQNADGFVDLIGQANITRDGYEVIGITDVILCADCVTQAARVVGCIPKKEAVELSSGVMDYQERYSKAADEAAAWQQRYENLVEIMSLLELVPKNADSDSDIEFVPPAQPKPDLRVQEGRIKPTKGNGTRTTHK